MLKVAGVWRASALDPPYQDVWPILSAALDLFGASRLMWGSDYPAPDGDRGYPDAIAAIRSLPFIDPDDRDKVMAATARVCWNLPEKRSGP
jgi:predicted TIM-barrel fold metal-dependent hydrolase